MNHPSADQAALSVYQRHRAAFSLSSAQRIPFPVPDPLPLSYLLRPLRDDALTVDRIVVRSALYPSLPSAAQVFFGADPGQ